MTEVGDDLPVTEFDDLVLEDLVAKKRQMTREWSKDGKTLSPITVNQAVTKLI